MKATLTLHVDIPADAKMIPFQDAMRIMVEAFDGQLRKFEWDFEKVERVSRSEPREAETIGPVTP